MLAARSWKLAPATPASSAVAETLPSSCREVAPKAKIRPKVHQHWASWAPFWPDFAELNPNLSIFDHLLAELGRFGANLGRSLMLTPRATLLDNVSAIAELAGVAGGILQERTASNLFRNFRGRLHLSAILDLSKYAVTTSLIPARIMAARVKELIRRHSQGRRAVLT